MIIGIDPGRTGAMATLTNTGQFVRVEDLPIEPYRMSPKGKEQWRLDAVPFKLMLEGVKAVDRSPEIIIEWGWARPGMNVAALSGSDRLLGAIEAVVNLNGVLPLHVLPQAWKRHFGLLKQGKEGSLELARARFPDAPLTRKKDHNRAEALLIALYGLEVTQ